uniref:Uncharacterized protein n=1 Tax=Acrobeloides nanus TaxID=290746 RepID=A0A914DQY5_9BILA
MESVQNTTSCTTTTTSSQAESLSWKVISGEIAYSSVRNRYASYCCANDSFQNATSTGSAIYLQNTLSNNVGLGF